MTDFEPNNQNSILAQLPIEGSIDPLPHDVAAKLQAQDKPQFRELGQYIGVGYASGTEYIARLARAREAAGLESTGVETETRAKFTWEPGEVVDLNEVLDTAQIDEEVQITDYRGRRYNIVKGDTDLSILEAYDEQGHPLKPQGESLENKKVKLSSMKTWEDQALAAHGITSSESTIRLVEPDVQLKRTPKGDEEYTETRNGKTYSVAASRMQITLPEQNQSWGVLVSKIELVAKDQEEVEQLKVSQWRIADSAKEIHSLLGAKSSEDGIQVNGIKFEHLDLDDDGEISFVTYEGSEGDEVRTEHFFSPKGTSSEKIFLKAGKDWVAVRMPNQELDGTVKLTPQQAARKLDNYRYLIAGTDS